MDIKHTVIIPTYNQEKYISIAIESCLNQKIKPYEIIVSDDCSQDNTQKIILDYYKKYPEIIKLNFNKINLGIYKHLQKLTKEIEIKGDVISFLGGDDWYEGEMFGNMNACIKNHQLDVKKDRFLITPNTKAVEEETGKTIILDNYKLRYQNQFKLKLKLLTNGRFVGISQELFREFDDYESDFGIWADQVHAVDVYYKCEKFLFINEAHAIYRRNASNITNKTLKSDIVGSYIKTQEYLIEKYSSELNFYDKAFLLKKIYYYKLIEDKNCIKIFLYLYYHFVSFGHETLYFWIKGFSVIMPKSLILKLKDIKRKIKK